MALSKSSYNRKIWEGSKFPILCQTCLGSDSYIRMLKNRYGAECKICQRPFTCFRWMPEKGMRCKKTEVCQICAKMKNVCQTCLLDFEFGLSMQVRDQALQIQDDLSRKGASRDYYVQNQERELAFTFDTTSNDAVAKISDSASNDLLKKFAQNQPYYQRNKPHICSFFIEGECRRGEECPYRHEKPSDPDDRLSHQNILDRYHGNNDPVAKKLLTRAKTHNDYCVSNINYKT